MRLFSKFVLQYTQSDYKKTCLWIWTLTNIQHFKQICIIMKLNIWNNRQVGEQILRNNKMLWICIIKWTWLYDIIIEVVVNFVLKLLFCHVLEINIIYSQSTVFKPITQVRYTIQIDWSNLPSLTNVYLIRKQYKQK